MAEVFVNNASTTLAAGCVIGDTAIIVSNPVPFPTHGDFRLLIDSEIMLCTAVAGDTFTVTRAIESTTQANHAIGSDVTSVLTAGALATIGGGGGAPSGPAGGALAGTYPNPDLNSALAGSGLAFTSNVLDVNVDGSTIQIVSDTLSVKDLGITAAKLAGTLPVRGLGILYDGGGLSLTVPNIFFIAVPFGGTIIAAIALLDKVDTISVDVYKTSYSSFGIHSLDPQPTDKISASAPIAITSNIKSLDTTLAGWTKTVSQYDVFIFVMTTCSVATKACIGLFVEQS